MNLVAYNTIQDAIQAVAQKDVDYCLVPVENSIEVQFVLPWILWLMMLT